MACAAAHRERARGRSLPGSQDCGDRKQAARLTSVTRVRHSMPRGDVAMTYSISTLLTRNLHDVFGENDPKRRRVAIDEIFTEDCVFYDPSKGVYRGRDEIDR